MLATVDQKQVLSRRTGNAGEELAGEALDMCMGKGRKLVAFQEVEDALAEQISNNADVISPVEAFS